MRALVVVASLAFLTACGAGPVGPTAPSTFEATAPGTSGLAARGTASLDPPQNPAEGPLSGQWVGRTAEGAGLIATSRTVVNNCAHTCEDYCTNYYDFEGRLSHQGTRLFGEMTTRFAGADCLSGGREYHITPEMMGGDIPVPAFLDLSVTPSGGVSVPWDLWVGTVGAMTTEINHDLTGTWTGDAITLTGDRVDAQRSRTLSWSMTFVLRRPPPNPSMP